MPFGNAFSYEQTLILRTALDTALVSTGDLANEWRRREVANVLLDIMGDSDGIGLDVPTLAQLALDKLEEQRKQP